MGCGIASLTPFIRPSWWQVVVFSCALIQLLNWSQVCGEELISPLPESRPADISTPVALDTWISNAPPAPTTPPLAASGKADKNTVDGKTHEDGWWNGDLHIVPYGIGWLNVAYDSQRTSPGPFTLFANSRDIEPHDAFHVNIRATRLGLNFTGPDIELWKVTGRVEIDFFGAALTENRAGVLLRQAYAEMRYEGWRILGGQTNDVISPLNPNMLNYGVAYSAGNIGFRVPQLRLDHQWQPAEQIRLTSQGSLNRTLITDFADTTAQEGHDAGWPTVMARWAIAWLPADDPQRVWEIGVSGHVGQEAVDFETFPVQQDRIFNSWSLNADIRLPFTLQFGVQGEFFIGQTLSTFLGGINQGIDPISRNSIQAVGGWADVWWRFHESWHWHAGYGIDDPRDEQLSANRRARNQLFFTNVVWDISPHLSMGVEISRWDTSFMNQSPGQTWRGEMAMRYTF